jgi:ElaB/YqjD/DUF883 family membrane-anchored ribosome-binding protein
MAASPGKMNRPETGGPQGFGKPDEVTQADLEADIRQLREDVAKLTEQLAQTGQHSFNAARRAASEGVEALRAQGEAAVDQLKTNARDLEDQVAVKVREKPITALAIALGVGYFLALLSRR